MNISVQKILSLFILSIPLFIACQATKEMKNTTEIDKFTWDIQLAGYDFQRVDEKGETDYSNFINEFEKFPWIEQLNARNKMSEGTSPTLSVKDLKNNRDLWVSIAGDQDKPVYLIGNIYPKEVKGFLGFGRKTIRWCEIYLTENPNNIKSYFKLFFDRQFQGLENEIRKLEKFDELEAQN